MFNDPRWPFLTIDIELTNICTQNCLFCPREKLTRPKGFIEVQVLERIISQAAEIGSRVTFCGMGNPVLHPDFVRIGEICRAKGIRYGLTVQVPALNEASIAQIDAFVPGFIELSCSGIDQSGFASVYPGQNFEAGLHNIEKLVVLRGSSRGITIISVLDQRQTFSQKEVEDFWARKNLQCRVFACHSRGGNLKKAELITAVGQRIEKCGLFATHSFITWQGKMLACCHDLTGVTETADLSEISLLEAGEARVAILQKGMPWKQCSTCDEPAAKRPLPDRHFPESEKAKKRYLKRQSTNQQP